VPAPLSSTRLLVVLATWAAAVAVTLGVAATTKIGPDFTVFEGHGLHVGDILAGAVCSAAALAVTAAVLRRGRQR
jgi:hypothetical protein